MVGDWSSNPTPQPVAITAFSATTDHTERGRSVVLSWQVQNATTLDLDGQRVAPTDMREVTPLETTTYVLTAQGMGGPAQSRVTVTVGAQATGLLPDRGGFRCATGGLNRC